MSQAVFRFYSGLKDLADRSAEKGLLTLEIAGHETVKHLVESSGVPHTEVGLILANDSSVGFDYIVKVGDRVAVYPPFGSFPIDQISKIKQEDEEEHRFVLDVHLGRLAELLRMLGLDCRYQNDFQDLELAQISGAEGRILLSRDRGLLKRKAVTRGYLIRSKVPEEQAVEVIRRFNLFREINLLSRCAICGGLLKPVSREDVSEQLEPMTREHYQDFQQCDGCRQVFWKGTHYNQLKKMLQEIISRAQGS